MSRSFSSWKGIALVSLLMNVILLFLLLNYQRSEMSGEGGILDDAEGKEHYSRTQQYIDGEEEDGPSAVVKDGHKTTPPTSQQEFLEQLSTFFFTNVTVGVSVVQGYGTVLAYVQPLHHKVKNRNAVLLDALMNTSSSTSSSIKQKEELNQGWHRLLPAFSHQQHQKYSLSSSTLGSNMTQKKENVLMMVKDEGNAMTKNKFSFWHQFLSPHEILIPADTSRICIDVGTFISSPTSALWWNLDSRVFVIGFEPNPFTAVLLGKLTNPLMLGQMRGYWPNCHPKKQKIPEGVMSSSADAMTDCVHRHWGHVISHWQRFLLLPVALSDTSMFRRFQLGMTNRSDGGSLAAFQPKKFKSRHKKERNDKLRAAKLKRVVVPVTTLENILKLLPVLNKKGEDLLWDTLKIDAQGLDRLVVSGAGYLLSRFACIIGEFDTKMYRDVKKVAYKRFLAVELGFIRVTKNVWIQPYVWERQISLKRFKKGGVAEKLKSTAKGKETGREKGGGIEDSGIICEAPDVRLPKRDILARLERWRKDEQKKSLTASSVVVVVGHHQPESKHEDSAAKNQETILEEEEEEKGSTSAENLD